MKKMRADTRRAWAEALYRIAIAVLPLLLSFLLRGDLIEHDNPSSGVDARSRDVTRQCYLLVVASPCSCGI